MDRGFPSFHGILGRLGGFGVLGFPSFLTSDGRFPGFSSFPVSTLLLHRLVALGIPVVLLHFPSFSSFPTINRGFPDFPGFPSIHISFPSIHISFPSFPAAEGGGEDDPSFPAVGPSVVEERGERIGGSRVSAGRAEGVAEAAERGVAAAQEPREERVELLEQRGELEEVGLRGPQPREGAGGEREEELG